MRSTIGNALWLLLHSWADQLPWDLHARSNATGREFIQHWRALVVAHAVGCHCVELLDDFLQREPLPLDQGQLAVKAWTVRLHNEVNAKLGKPVFTLADKTQGPWTRLHEYAWSLNGETAAVDWPAVRQWYAQWRQRHFCGSCGATPTWLPEELPTECIQDARSFYWWTVAAHDRWNVMHGRPLHAASWSTQHALFHDLPLRNFKNN